MDEVEDIIDLIRRAGYAVTVHGMVDYIEMRALEAKPPNRKHIARVDGGDGPEETRRCAAELARMVGADLDGRKTR